MASKRIKIVIFALVSVLAVAIMLIPPFPGLGTTGMRFLAIFIWWIVMMLLELLPAHMSCLVALVLSVILGCATTEEAFEAYSGSTVWLLVGALGLAAAVTSSGLLHRVALYVMQLFPCTYKGQVCGLAIASMICAPIVPSGTAKCTLLAPLAGAISDSMGYEKNSPGALGFFNIVNLISNFGSNMFLTGSLTVPIMLSLSQRSYSWMGWLKVFVIYGIAFFAFTLAYVLIFNRPKENPNANFTKNDIKKMIEALGPMSKKEIAVAVIMVITVAMWATESRHHIPTFAVTIAAWVVMSTFGLFSRADFSSKLMWPIVVMVGGTLSISTLLNTTGVSQWLSALVAPVIAPFTSHSVLLLAILNIIAPILMFAMVSGIVQSAVFMSVLGAVTLDPILIVFSLSMASQIFVYKFQQAAVITAVSVYGDRLDYEKIIPSAWAKIAIHFLAMMVSVPWWNMLGML